MRRFVPALIVVGFVAPALATLAIRELRVRDVGAFVGRISEEAWRADNREELARRYHRGELPCRWFHDFSDAEKKRIIDGYYADVAASEWAGREGELHQLFRGWTDADEEAAHTHGTEDALDHLERRAGTVDRLRIWFNRRRIVEHYSEERAAPGTPSVAEPPGMGPEERRRLRLLWRKHRLAPFAIYLSRIAT